MSIGSEAVNLGLDYHIFYTLKAYNPDRFKMYTDLGNGSVGEGYKIHQTNVAILIDSLTTMYYALDDTRMLGIFSRHLYELGIFGKDRAFVSGVERWLFRHTTQTKTMASYNRYSEAVKAFPDFIEDYPELQKLYKEYSE